VVDQAIGKYDFAPPEDMRRSIDAVFEKQCGRCGLKMQELLPE
jgi:hypothetical protein